jgi:hypothetical protein
VSGPGSGPAGWKAEGWFPVSSFFETKLTLRVLHEWPIPRDADWEEIVHGDVEGHVITETERTTKPIDGKQMALALREAGATPATFGLDKSGRSLAQ